jgi:membrane-associated phospholipid phosphatase
VHAAVALALLLIATSVRGEPDRSPLDVAGRASEPSLRLRLDWSLSAVLAAGAIAGWGADAAYGSGELRSCRWCEPGRLDLEAREALRWSDPRAAGEISDALRLAVPLGSAAAVAWLAGRSGGSREAVEDLLAVATALAVTAPLTSAVKHGTARLRPAPWAEGRPGDGGELHSFFSGHTSLVFAAAAAATQVTRLRGRSGWRWLAAATFTAAAGTAWLRVAADQHWATDVLAGAAAGTTVGLAVPPLMLRRPGAGRTAPALAAAPGGLALVF